jgi:hypothetical protein
LSKTIAIDFDGVIHKFESYGNILGYPIDGAFDCIRTLIQRHPIYILCARAWHSTSSPLGGLNYMPHWFEMHQLGIPTFVDTEYAQPWEDKTRILITNRKLPATVYIDDRGLHFQDWPQTMRELVTRL